MTILLLIVVSVKLITFKMASGLTNKSLESSNFEMIAESFVVFFEEITQVKHYNY